MAASRTGAPICKASFRSVFIFRSFRLWPTFSLLKIIGQHRTGSWLSFVVHSYSSGHSAETKFPFEDAFGRTASCFAFADLLLRRNVENVNQVWAAEQRCAWRVRPLQGPLKYGLISKALPAHSAPLRAIESVIGPRQASRSSIGRINSLQGVPAHVFDLQIRLS